MADRDDPGERLARAEERLRMAEENILALRRFKHDHLVPLPTNVNNLISATEELEKVVDGLKTFKNQAIGICIGLSATVSVATTILLKYL